MSWGTELGVLGPRGKSTTVTSHERESFPNSVKEIVRDLPRLHLDLNL